MAFVDPSSRDTWLQNFFTGRTYRTKLGAHVSDIAQWCCTGSGIGPLLFLIYVNELIDILEKFGLKVKMFADDAKMYLRITDDTDVAQLQQAVDALINWANMWQLSISVNKCCVFNVGRVICNVSVNINGVILPAVEHTRNLRVLISSDLSPSFHVGEIAAKAHKRAALIHKAFVCRDANIGLLLRAYLVYVRHLLEFNSVIWSPHTVKDIIIIYSFIKNSTINVYKMHTRTGQKGKCSNNCPNG